MRFPGEACLAPTKVGVGAGHARPEASKKGTPAMLPVAFACQLTEVALLGTLALLTEQLLEWKSKSMHITNDPGVDKLVSPPYRAGWTL